MKMVKIVIQTCILLFLKLATCELIDPHSMDFGGYNPKSLEKRQSEDLYKSCEIQTFNDKSQNKDVYLKRLVSLLINSATFDMTPPLYFGELKINLAVEDYQFLNDFSKSENIDENMLRRLDSTLSEAFKKTFNDYMTQSINFSANKIFEIITSEEFVQLFTVAFGFLFLYVMFQKNFSFWYILKYMLLFFWLSDCYIKYIHMKQEFDRHNVKVMVSGDECNLTGFWNNIRYIFGDVNCNKKILSPFVVLEEQFKHIVGPLQYLGTGLGKFGYEMFANLPWGLNIVMFPLMLVFVGILSCITLSFIANVPFSLNFFHLINFKFGYTSKHRNENMLSENTLKRVLDAVSQRSSVQGASAVQGIPQNDNFRSQAQDKETQSSTPEQSTEITNDSCLNNTLFLERIEEILESTTIEKAEFEDHPEVERKSKSDIKVEQNIDELSIKNKTVPHVVGESGDNQ